MKNEELFCKGTSLWLSRHSLLFVLLLVFPVFSTNSGQSSRNPADNEASSLVQESLSRLLEASVDGSLSEDDDSDDDYSGLTNLDDRTVKRAPGWGKRAPGWGKRAPGWGKRAPGWGKRAPGWGKRTSPKLDSDEIATMLFSLENADNGDDISGFEKRAPGWGKRAPGWGKRTVMNEDVASFLASLNAAETADASSDTDKRAPGWGKRAPGWGKRAPGWGKRAPGWGKRDQEKRAPGWGKRAPGWGKRDTEKRAPGWGKRDTQGHNIASKSNDFFISFYDICIHICSRFSKIMTYS